MSDDVDYWDAAGNEERLRHTTLGDALDEWWDYLPEIPDLGGELSVTVRQYRRMRPTSCGRPLDYVLEILDEDYGDPDGRVPQPKDAMRRMEEAERAFVAAVLDAYESWACEEIGTVQVRVRVLPDEDYGIVSVDGLPREHPAADDEPAE